MARYIVKLQKGSEARYLEWSTMVDAPVTYGLTLEEFTEYYELHYGIDALASLPSRMARVEAHGTSSLSDTLDDLMVLNRAGEKEAKLGSVDELWKRYVEERPEPPLEALER